MTKTLSILFAAALIASPARADEVVERASEGFRAIHGWRVDQARDIAEALYADEPEHPWVLALVADVKLHMSDYAGAVTYFDRAKAAGAPELILQRRKAAEAARVATQGYVESVSDHFIIRHQPGKDTALVPYALETLEASLDRIGTLLGWRPDARIVVEFYPSADTLAQVSSLTSDEIANSGTIALCKWNRLMVTSPRAVVFGYGWRDTIAHELTHLIIGGASKNTVPIWLHEGIAKYVETAWRGDPGLALSEKSQLALREAAQKDKLITFEQMHPSMAKLPTQEQTALAFAEVFTFIEYLVGRHEWGSIRRVLAAMGRGKTEEQAFEAEFKKPLDKLAKAWMSTLAKRPIKRGGTILKTEREVVIKKRAESSDDPFHGVSKKARRYARAADLLYARGRVKAAQVELQKAFDATGSPMIGARLARIAADTGDLAAAEKAARAAIEGVPDLPGPNVTLAEVLVRQDKKQEASTALERAIAINPFDPRIHTLRLAILGKDGDPKERMEAEIALMAVTGQRRGQVPLLGIGGLVEIDALPFSRIYIEKKLDDRGVFVPTGSQTPTAPIAIKPGTMRIRMVPPKGPALIRTITVNPTGADARPQRIRPPTRGS